MQQQLNLATALLALAAAATLAAPAAAERIEVVVTTDTTVGFSTGEPDEVSEGDDTIVNVAFQTEEGSAGSIGRLEFAGINLPDNANLTGVTLRLDAGGLITDSTSAAAFVGVDDEAPFPAAAIFEEISLFGPQRGDGFELVDLSIPSSAVLAFDRLESRIRSTGSFAVFTTATFGGDLNPFEFVSLEGEAAGLGSAARLFLDFEPAVIPSPAAGTLGIAGMTLLALGRRRRGS